MSDDLKNVLHRYLVAGREALLWKLEGLSERDLRRPATPTGTNLLGLVKHSSFTELGYLGDCFDRPAAWKPVWMVEADQPDGEPNVDMWAGADESPEEVVATFRRVAAHADATIEELGLDAPGHVPWWGEDVTLGRVLVHLVAEYHRHAGHADLVRETLDGSSGLGRGGSNLPDVDADWWEAYAARLRAVADAAPDRVPDLGA